MEAFSLLKYWIGGGGGGGGGGGAAASMRLSSSSSTGPTTTITTTVPRETDESDDEGPFFDLEFTLPVEDDGFEEGESDDEEDLEADRDSTVSSSVGSGGSGAAAAAAAADPALPFSPSENLFFKGGELMSLEPSSSAPSGHSCENNSKRQFPVSLLRSATKFRVFLLGFKKAKPSSTEAASSPKQQHHSRFFTVKFKVEEVPIVSLFRRENSWRSFSCKKHLDDGAASEDDGISASEMKRLLKDVMHKYMKMLKPLNGRKDGGERHRFSGQLSLLSFGLGGKPSRSRRNNSMSSSSSSSSSSEDRVKKQQQRQGSLREVCRHLSKSRSGSSTTAGAAVTAAAATPPPPPLQLQSQRRDDSLLQQQDGIQSAIAHCKRSFNAPLESEAVAVC